MTFLRAAFVIFLCLATACAKNSDKAEAPPPNAVSHPQPVTPKAAREDWRHWLEVLWGSELGKMFRAYLDLPLDADNLTEAAHRLTDRIFKDADKELVRVAALQAMVESIYEEGQYSTDHLKKISILQLDIARKAWALYSTPKANAANAVPYLIILSAIGGSPEVQRQLRNLSTSSYKAGREFLVRGRTDRLREIPAAVEWRKLFSKQVFADYNVVSAANAFFTIFPPGLSLYLIFYSENPDLVGQRLGDQLDRYGKDRLDAFRNL